MAVINQRGLSFPTALKKTVIITGEEPQVTCDVAGKPVNFPMNVRATYPFLAVCSGLISPKSCLVVKTDRAPRSGLVLRLFLANVPVPQRKSKMSPSYFKKDSGKVLSGDL